MKKERQEPRLGREIRRLRLQSATTLRGMAGQLEVSASHLSDIEHDRRRPSEALLRKIAHELRAVGGSYESLHQLFTGIDPETRDWVASTPGVRILLVKVRESGETPQEILRLLEENVGPDGDGKRPTRKPAGRSARGIGKSVKRRRILKR